ncbi:MAG: DnaD domain protein [Eubacteriales bacterium]|nr:DnaD domain protein [Eubacteriales bacterium]
MEIDVRDIDWKELLIKKYRNYDLDEEEVMVLFVSDAILTLEPKTLITKDILSPYMKDQDGIDEALSKLLSKKFMTVTNDGQNFFTSLDDFKKKLFLDSLKDLTLRNSPSSQTSDSFYSDIESIVNRTLTPLERDQVSAWLKSGADEGMIKEALQRSITKSGNVSFKTADKKILEMERSQSRNAIGASTVNEGEKKNEELRDLFRNTDWIHSDNDR